MTGLGVEAFNIETRSTDWMIAQLDARDNNGRQDKIQVDCVVANAGDANFNSRI